jgi:hypothetical protein
VIIRIGDLEMTAGDKGKLLTASDFPFMSANTVVDFIISPACIYILYSGETTV